MNQFKDMPLVDEFRHTKKDINDKEKTITHYISSGDSNRYGQILPINGFEEGEYRKNPIVMWQHGTTDTFVTTPAKDQLDFVIGTNQWLKPDGNYLMAKTKFRDTELANDIFECNKLGFLNAWSKYFYPISEPQFKDGFMTIEQWSLYEYSSVIVPVDANAVNDLSVNRNMMQVAKSPIMKNFLTKQTVNNIANVEIDKLLKPIQDEINSIKEATKNLLTINEVKKETINIITQYNKKLSETLPGIVGDKIVDSLGKINLANMIQNEVAGAIRKVTGIL